MEPVSLPRNDSELNERLTQWADALLSPNSNEDSLRTVQRELTELLASYSRLESFASAWRIPYFASVHRDTLTVDPSRADFEALARGVDTSIDPAGRIALIEFLARESPRLVVAGCRAHRARVSSDFWRYALRLIAESRTAVANDAAELLKEGNPT
jgi:hypothetical protein